MKLSSAIAGLLALATLPSLHAETLYQVTDLGSLRPDHDARAAAINRSGDVAGKSDKTKRVYRAFRVRDGVMKGLGTLGGDYSYATGIDDDGDVVGASEMPHSSAVHAFLYRGGDLIDLGTLGGGHSHASGINNRGKVVGDADRDDGFSHAFLYENGKMSDLGTLGGRYSFASAINDAGQVVGTSETADESFRAFLYSDGIMTNLGADKGFRSEAVAINAAGEVAGYTLSGRLASAFLYNGGEFHPLGQLPKRPYCVPSAINDNSEIVGSCAHRFGKDLAAFLYRDGRMIDLNKKLDPVSGEGWELLDASGINASGQIVGSGRQGDLVLHAYLLTPMAP